MRVTASATVDNGTPAYTWDWGDGTTSSGDSVTKTYDVPGIYNITLTVTSPEGLSVFTTATVFVGSAAEAGAPLDPTSGALLISTGLLYGDGKLSVGYVRRDKTKFQSKLKRQLFPASMTLASLQGKNAVITIGTGSDLPKFIIPLDGKGKGKSGQAQIAINLKKAALQFKVFSSLELTDYLEAHGADSFVPKPGKKLSLPMTLQIGDRFFLGLEYRMIFTANTTTGKGFVPKK